MPIEPLPWWRIAAPVLVFALLALARFTSPQPRIVIIWRTCVAVIGYAMLQDQVSARLSPAYFTIGHNPIPNLHDPTLLGLVWGFLGGFPGGILLGARPGLLRHPRGRSSRLAQQRAAGDPARRAGHGLRQRLRGRERRLQCRGGRHNHW